VVLVVVLLVVAATFFLLPLFRHCFFSLFPLLPLSTTFFSLYSGVVEVLVVVADRRMAEMVVGLWSAVFSLSSFFFSKFLCSPLFPFLLLLLTVLLSTRKTVAAGGGGEDVRCSWWCCRGWEEDGGLFSVSGSALLLLSSPA
jgi:hypothetical protein